MVVFPAAKINLGLYVTNRREDGYHNIETLFYPIGFSDILEVVPVPDGPSGTIDLTLSGASVEGSLGTNLVVRSYDMLNERKRLPGVRAYLHKCIPTGAGLGGGSSDGASMLKVLIALFGLDVPPDEIVELALALGSDCPFFLDPQPSYAHGRGEILEHASITLRGYYLQLFHPGTGISTAAAYKHVQIGQPEVSVGELEKIPIKGWREVVKNVFEPYAFMQQPVIEQIKYRLYESGALFASMTGSGSAVYGLFDCETEIPHDLMPYFIWKERL
jgi:4-diphosphocytidyl-2-C-methyl-D-erythritol kinase